MTLALWSHRFPLGWHDHLKALPLLQGREDALRALLQRLGLARQFDLRGAEYYDYYPTERGFVGMKVRKQIERGPVADHVRNVLCILQATGNESVAMSIAGRARVKDVEAKRTFDSLLAHIKSGRAVEGRLAPHQFRVPHMHFTREDIERALSAQTATEDGRGRELAAS